MREGIVLFLCLWAVSVVSTRLSQVSDQELFFEQSLVESANFEDSPPDVLSYWLNYFSTRPNTIVGQIRPARQDESDESLCIGVVHDYDNPFLSQLVCRDVRAMFWAYDTVNRTLTSIRFPEKFLAVNLRRSGDVSGSYHLTPFLKEEIDSENYPFRVSLSMNSDSAILFTTDSEDSRHCMHAPADNSYDTHAIPLVTDDDVEHCTLLSFVAMKDLFLEGQIKYNNETECLRYDLTAVPPRSVLRLGGACNPKDQSQIFMYNRVNGHLRAKTQADFTDFQSNPVLFMWWSGAIKAYTDVQWAEKPGSFGWDMRTRYFGAVLSTDRRGYSGNCWMVAGQEVIVNQTCSLFKFTPFAKNGTNFRTNKAVRIQAKTDTGLYCLALRFDFDNVTYTSNGREVTVGQRSDSLRWLPCSSAFTDILQRFLLGTEEYCKPYKACVGAFRWVGDLSKGYLGLNQTQPLTFRVPLRNKSPAQFSFVMNEWSPIYLPGPNNQREFCWRRGTHNVVLVPASSNQCTSFKVSPLDRLSPIENDKSVLVQRFVAGTVNNLALHVGGEASKHSIKSKSKLVADLGVYGARRFTKNGPFRFSRSGKSLVVNENKQHPGSVTFPFVPQRDLANSSHGLITVEFRLNADEWPQKTKASYLIFGFEKTTGCTVFMTYTGNLGLTCMAPKRYSCVFRFNDFSLADYRRHVVSLLYSTVTGGFHRLFVDYQEVGQCENPGPWNIVKSSSRLFTFYQPGEWRFRPLPALFYDLMVWAGQLDDLDRLARDRSLRVLHGGHEDEQSLPPEDSDPSATLVPPIKTQWENCVPFRFKDSTSEFNDTLRCDISITLDGEPYETYLDIFSLGCSRPDCWIFFKRQGVTEPSSRYSFYYQPRFPMTFQSENVGTPAPFSDISILTDGFSYGPVSFGMKYVPESPSESAIDQHIESSSSMGDVVRYICVEASSTCTCRLILTDTSPTF
eukprot:TRINITY_DN4084_c0_g1_i2.p1 TRINITY_DN4084_c0_g1~~TRINITY_DN4084_c0_g1_i2.p1  ORF type:complete len:959 (+),score=192.03 TRINITY_DN4084_c0_g1_i2:73-2949(+)